MNIPFVQVGKWRHKEVKSLAKHHTTLSDGKPGSLNTTPAFLITMLYTVSHISSVLKNKKPKQSLTEK